MGWSREGSDMGPRWSGVRQKVLRDSGGVCARCGEDGACEVDHVVSRRNGGSNEYSNLQALCRACHASKSSAEGNAAKARLKAKKSRPVGRHPGRA
jgi:5-methylcytosine-specific restriction endonuclease McrA